MQQLIVLSTPDGIVDMTPQAIAARTSIPLDIIKKGLSKLEETDPYSRTPGDDGRRIVLIDEHRPWGWRLVNHWKYMRLRNMAQKREADRVRIADKRKKNKDVASVSHPVADVAHSDSDSDSKTIKAPPPSGAFLRFWAQWPKSLRKQSQGKCWSLWRQRDFDQQAPVILAHVEALKASPDWRKDGGAFVPAPLVYLNQRRWEGADLDLAADERKVAMP